MDGYKQNEVTEREEDVLEALMRLPVRNLESRIQLLEAEIASRQVMNELALSDIGTLRLRLEEQLRQLRYASPLSPESNTVNALRGQMLRLEETRLTESINCFKDVSEFREKIQEADEQLQTARQRLSLISIGGTKETMEHERHTRNERFAEEA